MRVRSFVLLFAATLAFAGKTPADLPVASYLSDINASGVPYFLQSDGLAGPVHGALGEYDNGQQGVTSLLLGNVHWKDWELDALSSTARTLRITLSTANAIPAGQLGANPAPNPPFSGTDYIAAEVKAQCQLVGNDMYTMTGGQSVTCPLAVHMPSSPNSFYALYMAPASYPETTLAQVQCNSAVNGACNDWFIDPVPVTNPDGTTSPGTAIARLEFVPNSGKIVWDGDFYLTFHIHVTQP